MKQLLLWKKVRARFQEISEDNRPSLYDHDYQNAVEVVLRELAKCNPKELKEYLSKEHLKRELAYNGG